LPLRRPDDVPFDPFVPFVTDLPLRDQRETMERPFFSLSKKKRLQPIDYQSPDGSVWVRVEAVPSYGMATIWDADILIWAASILVDMKKRRLNDVPRSLHFHPYDLLRAIRRSPGGREYELLRGSLRRLQSTTISTNIRARNNRRRRQFSWLDSWTEVTAEDGGNVRGMSLTISDWLYEGILMEGGVLAIAPEYFDITGGRERWLYRVARKHAGGHHDGPGFAILLPTLFNKAGAEGTYRRFKHETKRIVQRNDLPEFFLIWEDEGREEPCLRMVRRSALAPDHPGHEIPRRHTRRVTRSS
jgi:plasmid replication initiation protein